MSLHYLLDGYNIIKQVPDWADKSLEDGRLSLIRWVNADRPHGSVHNKVTIVFDGKADAYGTMDGGCALIVFSQYGSADDLIKEMLESIESARAHVVVSNDKDITIYARALGAKIMSVAEFTQGKTKLKSQSHSKAEKGKYISQANQNAINKELSKLWLKGHENT